MVTQAELRAIRSQQQLVRAQVSRAQQVQAAVPQQQQIEQQIEQEKQARAGESTVELDRRIAEAEERFRGNPTEEQRFLSDSLIEQLERAKSFAASGNFATDDLVRFAVQSFDARLGRRDRPTISSTPTPTEIALQQNLLPELRHLPPEEVIARQSILGGFSALPPSAPTPTEIALQQNLLPELRDLSEQEARRRLGISETLATRITLPTERERQLSSLLDFFGPTTDITSPFIPRTAISEIRSSIQTLRDKALFKQAQNIPLTTQEKLALTGAGILSFGIGILEVGADLPQAIISPVETGRAVGGVLFGQGLSGIGQIARAEPEFVTGGIIAGLIAPELTPSIIRTIKTLKIPRIPSKRGQVAVAQFEEVRDALGNLVGFKKKARTAFDELTESLEQTRTARVPQLESELREATRKLIDQARNNPKQLNALRRLYQKTGREDLFNDIIQQEISVVKFGKPPKLPKPTAKPTKPTTTPPALGGVFAEQGEFAGRGQFERTTEIGIAALRGKPISKVFTVQPQLDFLGSAGVSVFGLAEVQKTRLQQLQAPSQAQQLQQRQIQSQLQLQLESQASTQRSTQRLAQRLGISFGSAQILRQAQRQRQLQRTRQELIQRQRIGEILRIPRKPRKPPKIITPEEVATFRKRLTKLKAKAKAFDVLVKRQGKFRKVADDLPFNRALKKGAEITRNTIASTFKVVPDKKAKPKLKDIRFRPDPKVFRDFKISGGRRIVLPEGTLIERKLKRLKSPGEIRDILKFQRRARQARGGARSKKGARMKLL